MMVAYWAFRDYLQEIAEIRNRYTSHMAKSVVETMKVFTIQQETQIQQLIEGMLDRFIHSMTVRGSISLARPSSYRRKSNSKYLQKVKKCARKSTPAP